MDIKIVKESEFIPQWNDNREQADPLRVLLQALTTTQRTECVDFGVDENGQTVVRPKLRLLCKYGVKEIKNLSAEGTPIKTVDDLLSSRGGGLEVLLTEIGMEILVRNRAVDLKNSSLPSG